LENATHETYARHRANGLIPARAAVAAGYVTGTSITTELERDPKIIARIEELMEERNARTEARKAQAIEAGKIVGTVTGMSHAWVLEKLGQNAIDAAQEGDFKESNAALKLIGEQLGMWGKVVPGDDAPGRSMPDQITDAAMERIERLNGHLDWVEAGDETPIAIVDQRDVDHLLGRVPPAPAAERDTVTGSESDVALRAAPAPTSSPMDALQSVEELMATLNGVKPSERADALPQVGEAGKPQRRARRQTPMERG
jgi:hypothetical protein